MAVRGNSSSQSQGTLVLFLVFCLCTPPVLAAYKRMKIIVQPAENYSFHQKQGAICIAADPYETQEKIRTAFDLKELSKVGIVPVHLIVTNGGLGTISISGNSVNMLDAKNRAFTPLSPDDVVRAVLQKGSLRTSRNPLPVPPFPKGNGRRGDAFEIQADITNKALKDLRIPPDSTLGGFLFFRLPDNQMRLSGYKIYLPEVRDLKSGKNLLFFEIELK